MRAQYIELLEAARQTCQACRVKAGEAVVVFSDTTKNEVLVEAFYAAAVSMGAQATLVLSKAERVPLVDPPAAAVAAMMEADMVFDLATQPWLYTEATNKILGRGARVLQVLADESSVIHRPPTPEISERSARLAARLKGQRIRITSQLGTDLRVERDDRPVHFQDGCVTHAGDWDSLGVVVAAFAPPETKAEGRVIVNGPVYLGPRLNFHVETPVVFELAGGRVVGTTGEGREAKIIARFFEESGDPNARVIAHTGFGMDPRADIWGADIGNWESYDGGINVAFGGNNIPQLQGRTACRVHVDTILVGATLSVDGKEVVRDGIFADG
ncbi:MAG: hypothetical protein RDU89_01850 [bacterium]|nr:hypothetical protein [bacterium]